MVFDKDEIELTGYKIPYLIALLIKSSDTPASGLAKS